MPQSPAQEIIEKAWNDPAFKARLLAAPHDVIAEHGVTIPDGITCQVVEDTPSLRHFVLPARPSSRLSDDDLDAVAGGGDVQLSPNVINACRQVNEAGGLQFDVLNYAQQNAPMVQYNPYPYWYGGPAPNSYR